MTADSVPQSLNVRCPACRNRFPAEAPAWGRTVPCPTCAAPCDVPVPLGVDIAPQWMSAEEKQKAAAAHRPEPVLDVGLKDDSSDAVPAAKPQRKPVPSGSTGVAWTETGKSSGPSDSRSATDGRGTSDSGRARRSAGRPTSDIDESDLIDEDDDLLDEIEAGARQEKYAPKTREPKRRSREEERGHRDASFDVSRDWRERYAERNETESSESWYAFIGIAMTAVGALSVVATFFLGPYTLVLSATFLFVGAVLVAKSRGWFDSWL